VYAVFAAVNQAMYGASTPSANDSASARHSPANDDDDDDDALNCQHSEVRVDASGPEPAGHLQHPSSDDVDARRVDERHCEPNGLENSTSAR